ncbi:hypothetical protein BsWGS_13314 [Bradybaena similaris]
METSVSLALVLQVTWLVIDAAPGHTHQRDKCEYVHISDWSECDLLSMTSTRSLELSSGDSQKCKKYRIETRSCSKNENRINNDITRHHPNKSDKKRQKARKAKTSQQTDCRYRKTKWSSCDVVKDYTQTQVQTLLAGSAAHCQPMIVQTRPCTTKLEMVEAEEESMGVASRRGKKNRREEHRRRRKQKNQKEPRKSKGDKNEPELPDKVPPPAELRVEPHATFILMSWRPAHEGNFGQHIPVDSYTIGYGQGFPDLHIVQVSGQEVTYTINNLEPRKEYIVSLRAKATSGISEALYETVRTRSASEGFILLAPVSVRAQALSSESVNVSWVDMNEENPPDKRKYHVRYRQLNHLSSSSDSDGLIQQTIDTHVVVRGLQPYTQYMFSVMVSDGQRNSSWSVGAWNLTLEAVPSTPPEDLTAIQDPENYQQVIVSWQPPAKANGIVIGYRVSYTHVTSNGSSQMLTQGVPGSDLSVTLMNLAPGTYNFSVRAKNSRGLGPPSVIKNYFMSGASSVLTLKASPVADDPKAVALSWQMVDPSPRNIIGFVILSTQGISNEPTQWEVESRVRRNLRTALIENLQPATKYYFKVEAENSPSTVKLQSDVVMFETPEERRTSITHVETPRHLQVNMSSTSAVVTWQDTQLSQNPETDGAPLSAYTVRYSSLGRQHTHYTIISSPFPTLHVADLMPLTWYEFMVKAHRGDQESDWSLPVKNKTLPAVATPSPVKSEIRDQMVSADETPPWPPDIQPTKRDNKGTSRLPHPEQVQVLVMSSNSALISWHDPGLADSQRTGKQSPLYTYRLRYRDLTRQSEYKFASLTLPSIFMVDLEPATRYEFSVRIDSGDVHSQWTAPVINTTFESAPSSSPSHVTVSMDDGDPTTAFLTWQPPQFPNGDITGYIVFYETATERKSAVVAVGELSYRVPFLKPHTKYIFRIGARNSQGFSPLSNRVVYRTPRVVGTPPTDVTVTPSSEDLYNAVVSWQPPSPSKRKIKFYTVTHYTEDGKQRTVLKVPGFTLTTVAKKLLPSSVYHFTVQAHYQRGSGPHSTTVKYSIPKELLSDS